MKCENFCNVHCITSDCPNIQCDMADDKWGDGIAEDLGLERIRCKDCAYEDKHCDCDDCYFKDGKECPRTEMLMKIMHDIFEIIISGMRKNTQTGNDMVLIAYRMLYDGRC